MSLFGKLVRSTAAAAFVALGASAAVAQEPGAPPAILNVPGWSPEAEGVSPASGFGRGSLLNRGTPAPCAPCPQTPCTPCPVTGQPMNTVMEPPPVQEPTTAPDFGARGRGADVGPTTGMNGYIENAAPTSMARLRFDSLYNSNRPDRGNFFYAKPTALRQQGQREAIGVPLQERNVSYQELTVTGEYAFTRRFSAFFDLPVRFINPDINANDSGLGDIGFGGKYAVVYNPCRIVSLFLRFQAPAGRISTGLGNGNWWIEPGVLYLEQLTEKWQLFGEFRFMAPLGVRTDFTGNLLRYGLGTSYVIAQGRWGYVAPVVEVVGWTVLSGKETNVDSQMPVGASGDTIVNAKVGLRVGLGTPVLGTAYPTRSDLYIGYGRALTGEVWYKDLLRVEFRRFF
jgi:hypothetical protein